MKRTDFGKINRRMLEKRIVLGNIHDNPELFNRNYYAKD